MILSRVIRFAYAGATAQLLIVRNDGACWGEMLTGDGQRLRVETSEDQYDRIDEDAAESFIAATRNASCIHYSYLELQFEARKWSPGKVQRPDAGGNLWTPVDQDGIESGDTPSYDGEAVQRRCNELNQRERLKQKRLERIAQLNEMARVWDADDQGREWLDSDEAKELERLQRP